MKIKHWIISLFLVAFWIFWYTIQDEDCSYLEKGYNSFLPSKDCGGSAGDDIFNCQFPIKLCEKNKALHKEAREYVRAIREKSDQTPTKLVRDIGNTFCRGSFCSSEESLYYRFIDACEDARDETIEWLPEDKRIETIDGQWLIVSVFWWWCEDMATSYMQIYKEAGLIEWAANVAKTIENSNKKYLEKINDKNTKTDDSRNTFMKMFGSIARAFQWFTRIVYNVF